MKLAFALTDMALRSVKPRAAPFKLADGGGLFALINPNGSVLWRYNYMYAGKAKTLALGQYPAISLKEARELHQEAKRSLNRGIDPLEARQAARADLEAARAARKTFKDAAAGWRELINKKSRAEKTRDRDERMISYLTGAFGNKPMDEVEAKDLIDLLETMRLARVCRPPLSISAAMRRATPGLGTIPSSASPTAKPSPHRPTGRARRSPRPSRSDSSCATSPPILDGGATLCARRSTCSR
jgi:Arm DNA-binding domain